jgi:hypothetical protein
MNKEGAADPIPEVCAREFSKMLTQLIEKMREDLRTKSTAIGLVRRGLTEHLCKAAEAQQTHANVQIAELTAWVRVLGDAQEICLS